MSSETPDEAAEKSTVLKHVATAAFPEAHLAPWMSIHERQGAAVVSALKTVADIGLELDRRIWLDEHPGKKKPPKEMEDAEMAADPEFDPARVRGAAGMFAYCAKSLAVHTHDVAPSIGGLGRKQAMSLGMAQKSGVAVEPKERSRWEKITGRGKDKGLVSGLD